MLQLSPARKNKINLSDYNSSQDIHNRILMSDFSPFDIEVLSEILYSPLKISLKKLTRSLDTDEETLRPILDHFSTVGLLSYEGDTVLVDKELRKYFEFQIQRFDSEFRPDMEFLQGLLRKVPIHVLPAWYSLPRSSNNIFESIVEKHLLSPQIYHRYLLDLNLGDPVVQGIMDDVLGSPDLKVNSSDLISKYNLTRQLFEEVMLLLEFNFVCCVSYIKEDDHWLEIVTPFYEWAQYLRFLKQTEAPLIAKSNEIIKRRERDYAFLEDVTTILNALKKKPQSIESILTLDPLAKINPEIKDTYLSQLIEKTCLLKLAEKSGDKLQALAVATDFLEMNWENKALYFYRNAHNQILSYKLTDAVATERNIRESEKAIRRVLHGGWVYLDDFLKGVLVPLSESSVIMLKKIGKHWRYTLPVYSEPEQELIKATIFEWLFEAGLVSVGMHEGRECFAVTAFGRFFFED